MKVDIYTKWPKSPPKVKFKKADIIQASFDQNVDINT